MKIRFGEFTFDSGRRRLARHDDAIALSPKAFDLLAFLIENRPNVVPKKTILEQIWPDTFVVDTNVNLLVSEIRRALGDDPDAPRFIETVHRAGFAFCADAEPLEARPQTENESPRFWLVWNDRTFVLADGTNTIGRDPKCQVWLDESSVSRVHAQIDVDAAANRASLQDLGSTNGTFLRGARVAGAIELSPDEVVTVGSIKLTFRRWHEGGASKTRRIRS